MEEHKQKSAVTAREYLKNKGLKNPPLDSGISGGGDAPRRYASDMMEEWSQLNGRFRDKAITVAHARLTELEEENKRLRDALEEIYNLIPGTPMPIAKRIAEQALKENI